MTGLLSGSKIWLILLCGMAAVVEGTLGAAEALAPVEDRAIERRPYVVQLQVAFDADQLDARSRNAILLEVRQTAVRCIGDLWQLDVNEIDWLGPVNQRGLGRLDLGTLKKHHPQETADIWFIAAINALPVGWRISLRSWQPEVQSETRLVSVDVLDQRDLAVALVRLSRDLFRPMGIVEQVNDRAVRIRMRAGELTAPDPSFEQLVKGEVLVPLLAYRNKEKAIEKLQTIPWTFITVDEVEGSRVSGTVQSGLRMALGGKKRGRIDTLVVALRPQEELTELELLTQTKPPRPLVGHRLEIRTSPILLRPSDEHPEIDPLATLLDEKLTDRRGLCLISADQEHRLVWLFAYSGQHLLARVPFVPGAATTAHLEVSDDTTRLAAEADLQMLQGEIIDAVALRTTAVETIRAAAKKDDWTTVNQKLTLIKERESVSTLRDRLTAVRVAGVAAAKKNRDKGAEARIQRMCDDASTLINVHLGGEKIRLLTEEMEGLQSATKETDEPRRRKP